MTAEEQPLRRFALFGATVLVIHRLQIFDLRHHKRTAEALDDPAGETDMVGMRMGHNQPGDFYMLERPFEQRGPRRDRLLVAESGIDHGPAVAIGQQVDVHMVEAEWQLQPHPQHTRHYLDDLIRPGMAFPRIAQSLDRGLDGFSFRMHASGLAGQSARRQPKFCRSRMTPAQMLPLTRPGYWRGRREFRRAECRP